MNMLSNSTPFVTVANLQPPTSIDSQNNLEGTWYKYPIYVSAVFDADWRARENSEHFVNKFNRARKKERKSIGVYWGNGKKSHGCRGMTLQDVSHYPPTVVTLQPHLKSWVCQERLQPAKVFTTNIHVNGTEITWMYGKVWWTELVSLDSV
jgi:hypothetical protein